MAPLSDVQRTRLFKYIEHVGESVSMGSDPKPDALVELRSVERAACRLCDYARRLIEELGTNGHDQ
jgi:hypothetical protein